MDDLARHELFEIEILDRLKSGKLLDPLVFGGGTMLRLCHGLTRYSLDLDFWFVKEIDENAFFDKMNSLLARNYEITDSQKKFNSLLTEIRSHKYPMKLKIEIRRNAMKFKTEDSIAFSIHGNSQVILRTHTLEQTLENKIAAALDRQIIRDFYDIEFLLRKGVKILIAKTDIENLKTIIKKFSERDYKVTLGSLLDAEIRAYYIKNKFNFLLSALNSLETLIE